MLIEIQSDTIDIKSDESSVIWGQKMLHWRMFRVVRVPPLKISWGTSRPMRSQHFELSTNQRPRFQQNFRHQPNLRPSNELSLCHCKVTVSLNNHLNQISPNGCQKQSMDCQFANAMPLEPLLCHCVTVSTTGITIRIIFYPVFIVQLKFMGPLLGHLPL